MPSQTFFGGYEEITVAHPLFPGRLVTIHALPRLAEAIGVLILGFSHVDEFFEWLESDAVAPFWKEFTEHFLFRSPGHIHDPRVEAEYLESFFNTRSQLERLIYMCPENPDRPINRIHWTPRQHYLRFTSRLVYHRMFIENSNPDVWPNFDMPAGLPPGWQAWYALGFLIAREQVRDNAGNASPFPDSHGDPRTPTQSPYRRDSGSTAMPEYRPRTPRRGMNSESSLDDSDSYPEELALTESDHESRPPSVVSWNTLSWNTEQERAFADEIGELPAGPEPIFESPSPSRRDSASSLHSSHYSPNYAAPDDEGWRTPTPGNRSARAGEEHYGPAGPADYNSWVGVLNSALPTFADSDSQCQELPALQTTEPPSPHASPLVHPTTIREDSPDGGWVVRHFHPMGVPDFVVEYAADGTEIGRRYVR